MSQRSSKKARTKGTDVADESKVQAVEAEAEPVISLDHDEPVPMEDAAKAADASGGLSLDDGDDEKLVLVAKDGTECTVHKAVATRLSALIKKSLESEEDKARFALPNCNGPSLQKIAAFMNHYASGEPQPIPKPLKSKILAESVPEWDANLVDMPNPQVFDLIMAANFMDIKPLLDLACACVASRIKGRSTTEIRSILNIENDTTPEEEAALKEKHKWIEDQKDGEGGVASAAATASS